MCTWNILEDAPHRVFKWVNPIYVTTWGRVFIWKGEYCTWQIKQFCTKHPTYLSTLKICRVGLLLNCFMLSSLPCFYAFCWSAIPTTVHLVTFLMFYISVHVTFFGIRCMLELKCCDLLQSSKSPSQASYAVLAEESLTRSGFPQTLPAHQLYF